jgi:RNA polymerase sigma factor (sigma-70 family)
MRNLEILTVLSRLRSDLTDEDVVEDASTESLRASVKYDYNALVLPLRGEMVAYATNLANGDEARGEDCVQVALVKAWSNWDRWVPYDESVVEHSVRAWLFRVVMHTFYKDHRRQKFVRRMSKGQDEVICSNVHATPADTREQIFSAGFCDEVARAIATLSDERRQVIEMYYVREMCCEEISQEIGIPKNTVFTRLARARAQIAKLLAPVAPRLGLRQLRA